jgi:Tetratricopeptide repeat
VKERQIKCIAVSTGNGANLGGQLDRRTLADALRETTDLHQAGKLAEAERAYRQILEVDPGNADVIHRPGQLLTTRGRHGPARQQFAMLTTIMPDTHKFGSPEVQDGKPGSRRPKAAAYSPNKWTLTDR